MTEDFIILFKRTDDYPLSGICEYVSTSKMKKQVMMLYNWLLNKESINIILEDSNQVFFNSIYMFCVSNDLDPTKTLEIKAFIKNGLNFLEIKQADTTDEPLIFNKNIYSKLIYEKNEGKELTIHELNNLEKAHALARQNMQRVMRSSILKSIEDNDIDEAQKTNQQLEEFFEKTI